MKIELPISKSIANRLLIRRAMRGDDVTDFVSSSMPEDVQVMARCLTTPMQADAPTRLDIGNCGTAMRFLTAYFAQKDGTDIILDGCERMHERPIGQEVNALRKLGADITYLQKEGYPPLQIHGRRLKDTTIQIDDPQSTQFISALRLTGFTVMTNAESPYLTMTEEIIKATPLDTDSQEWGICLERDWSSAAFFYEWAALQNTGTELFFPGLTFHSLQGDKACAELFNCLGVCSCEEDGGIRIRRTADIQPQPLFDMTAVPDLYPAMAVACHQLGVAPEWILPESLQWKESDRLQAIRKGLELTDARAGIPLVINTYNDHRIAMAFAAAGYPISEQTSISKSFPGFFRQLEEVNTMRS